MSEAIELNAQIRTPGGKSGSRRLRREDDQIPAIIYGGADQPVALAFQHNKVIKALENEAFYSSILTINVEGKQEQAVLKNIQRHSSQARILHLDLQRVTGKEAITMRVPLHFIGEDSAPGVKEGGIVTHDMTDVEIKCLPQDLPEHIKVDLSKLELDQALHLSDITPPTGVTLTVDISSSDHDLPIASIHTPRVVEEEPVAEEGEEAAAPEGEGEAAADTEGAVDAGDKEKEPKEKS